MLIMEKRDLIQYAEWQELAHLSHKNRFQKKISNGLIQLEILHHQLTPTALNKLATFIELQGLEAKRRAWLEGDVQDLPAFMHLRRFENSAIGLKYYSDVCTMRQQMKDISDKVRAKKWLGYSGKPITDVINIGIGGSDLGPKLYYDAFKETVGQKNLNCHFISDADYYTTRDCLKNLNPETSLFIVSSKSFSTAETMLNAEIAKAWIDHPKAFSHHFIAVTANTEKAKALGYEHILPFGEWVIGRFSVTSAISLINSIVLGFDNYLEFIKGAEEMDEHFLRAPWHDNLPIMLALVGIWNINIQNIQSQLLLVYHSNLRYFADYVQQLDMESNGKSHNQYGQRIGYATGPIVWGGLGNQSQHSYYQLLAQGSHQVAIDFISINDSKNTYLNQVCHQRKQSLYYGMEAESQAYAIQQQKSVNHIELNNVSPRSLGALISLYELKVFTQAWLWNINPFDQPGVESAKDSMKFINS